MERQRWLNYAAAAHHVPTVYCIHRATGTGRRATREARDASRYSGCRAIEQPGNELSSGLCDAADEASGVRSNGLAVARRTSQGGQSRWWESSGGRVWTFVRPLTNFAVRHSSFDVGVGTQSADGSVARCKKKPAQRQQRVLPLACRPRVN